MKREIAMGITIPEGKEEDFRLFTVLNGGKIESTETKGYSYMGYPITETDKGEYSITHRNETISFASIAEAVCFIQEVNKKPVWDVTFIWGFSLRLVTLAVRADNEEQAVSVAFEMAGPAFENELVSVKRRGENDG